MTLQGEIEVENAKRKRQEIERLRILAARACEHILGLTGGSLNPEKIALYGLMNLAAIEAFQKDLDGEHVENLRYALGKIDFSGA
jgi:hypothetical protein